MLSTEIRKVITDWVTAQVTPIIPRWADQDAPPPQTAYINLRDSAFQKVGDDFYNSPDIEGVAQGQGTREFTLSLEGIGTGALAALEVLRTSLDKPSVHDTLEAGGLVFVLLDGAVQNLSRLIEQNNVERGVQDIRFRMAAAPTDSVGMIADAAGTGTVKHYPGDTSPASVAFGAELPG